MNSYTHTHTMATTSAPPTPFLAKGDLVLLEGLTSRTDLNGRLVLANGKQRVRASDGAQQVSVTLLYRVDPLDGMKPFWAPSDSRTRLLPLARTSRPLRSARAVSPSRRRMSPLARNWGFCGLVSIARA